MKTVWSHCVGICINVVTAVTEKLSGIITLVKKVAPDCMSTHYIIHRGMLASRKMSIKLYGVLNEVIVINCIKGNHLDSRLFQQLCKNMEVDHKRRLLYVEMGSYLRGSALNRIFELKDLTQKFLFEKIIPCGALR